MVSCKMMVIFAAEGRELITIRLYYQNVEEISMRKFTAIVMAALLLTLGVTGCGAESGKEGKKEQTAKTEATKAPEGAEEADSGEGELLSGKHHVEIEVKDYGTIKVELYADTAPITVTNFMNLAQEGFYDGLTFHRIISGFMIQGGDPEGTGMGGSDQTIKGEFSSNGVENSLSHKRGVISMARSSDPDSASSQFFIMHQDSPYLDGEYAAFGEVTEGIEIVDKICEDTPVLDDNGTVESGKQPKIAKVEVID